MNEEKLIDFFRRYKGAVIGVLVGILLVILFFWLGFWKTVLALLIIFICAFLGHIFSKKGTDRIIRAVEKIFK